MLKPYLTVLCWCAESGNVSMHLASTLLEAFGHINSYTYMA
jgi:hypothetical protein